MTATTEAPARTPGGGLSPESGALLELAYRPELTDTERMVYLVLAVRPDLDRELLARVIRRAESTVVSTERALARAGMLDRDTRTALYPRTTQLPRKS
jgi:predicted transcriptional regulator